MKNKKLLKWVLIIIGTLFTIAASALLIIYFFFFKPDYESGGILSENQSYFDVTYYDINLEVQLGTKTISGNSIIKIIPNKDSLNSIELDLIDRYTIQNVFVNDTQAKTFLHENDKLWITPKSLLLKDSLIEINVFYSGEPPVAKTPPWRGGFTWTKDREGNAWLGLSCQGEGAKIWFPCKDHPSDEPDSAAINITVPEPYFVASNGLLKEKSNPRTGFTTFHWFTGYRTVMPVVFYVLPEYEEGAQDLLIETLDMLISYRKFFGEYPWLKEKCALVTTPFKGMEHQTLIAYGNDYRYSQIGDFIYDDLLLHELAHEWWGNKVTVRDWSDFWIQEGFATYAEALYVLDRAGEEAYHENIRRNKIRNWSPIKSEPNSTTHTAYQRDIYTKGAAFLHTLRYVLGDSIFFASLKEFATDSSYTYKNQVTKDDFLLLINKNSANDYSKLFDLYLLTTDLPQIKIDPISDNTFEVSIPNIDFELPMDIEYNDIIEQRFLGPAPIIIHSSYRPLVDEMDWYLKEMY
jgi:aminopeptidase N